MSTISRLVVRKFPNSAESRHYAFLHSSIMNSSLRLVPAQPSKSASVQSTANAQGLHDTLQYGPRSLAAELETSSTIKHRLEHWEETQDNLKLTMQRDVYGIHAPIRLLMERKIVSQSAHMPALPQSNLHLDILMGRDERLDVFECFGGAESGPPMDIHGEMEKKLRI